MRISIPTGGHPPSCPSAYQGAQHRPTCQRPSRCSEGLGRVQSAQLQNIQQLRIQLELHRKLSMGGPHMGTHGCMREGIQAMQMHTQATRLQFCSHRALCVVLCPCKFALCATACRCQCPTSSLLRGGSPPRWGHASCRCISCMMLCCMEQPWWTPNRPKPRQ